MSYNKSSVIQVIQELTKDLLTKKSCLDEAVKIDYKISRFKTDIDVLYNISKNSTDFEYNTITSANNIAVFYDGNPYVTITLAIKALQTNNNITFFANDNMLAINSVLIKMIDLILEKNNYTNNNIYFVNDTISNVIKIQNQYDMLIYVGSKFEYYKVKDKFKIKTLYNGYGSVTFYMPSNDCVNFESVLNDVDEYMYRNNIISDIYDESNVSELTENSSKFEPIDTFVVFSNDSDTIDLLKKKVKYKRIFINQNPFIDYCYLFTQNLP